MADRHQVSFDGAVRMASHILVVSPDWLAKTKTKELVSVEIVKIIHERTDWIPKQLENLHIPFSLADGRPHCHLGRAVDCVPGVSPF